jgi:hypothetical protein
MQHQPALLPGKRIAVLGSAGGLGLAVAKAATEAGAEVIGIDAVPGFDHVAEFFHVDPADQAAIDRLISLLPDGLDGLALFPDVGSSGNAGQAVLRGVAGPKRLAEGLAARMGMGGAIVTQGAPHTAERAAHLALIRASLALRPENATGFGARWGLEAEPHLTPKAIGWAMAAWAMQHRWTWAARHLRTACVITATPDGRLPAQIAALSGRDGASGQTEAAQAAIYLMSDQSAGLTGAVLAADGGLTAQIQTTLDGL